MKWILIILSALQAGCVMYAGKPDRLLDVTSLEYLNGKYIDQGTRGFSLSNLLLPQERKNNFWVKEITLKALDDNAVEVTVQS